MTEMAAYSPEKKSGCGLLGGFFRSRSLWPRRTTSDNSLPSITMDDSLKVTSTTNSKRRRGGSDETVFIDPSNLAAEKPIIKPLNHFKIPPPNYQNQGRKSSDATTISSITKVAPTQGRMVPKEAIGISGELDGMISDHQRAKGSGNLVRASSSNVMLFGHLGNLRQPGTGNSNSNSNSNNLTNSTTNVLNYLPKTARETGFGNVNVNSNGVMGNIVRKANEESHYVKEQPGSLCRALSTRMDPEVLKAMGNEDYKEGRFAEALALYDRAISVDPNKASYRSNKSAALTGLGRLLEAVFECREAINIEPSYHRAHLRLATLYLRLGEAEKALYHYKHSGPEAESSNIAQAQALQARLIKCTEARKLRDWNTLLKETGCAISSGADSAPQIFALQAEALLKLHRHQEADATLGKGPSFDVDSCTKFFGPVGNANLLLVRAQIDMAAGRFEDAVVAARRAALLDSSNKEVSAVVRRTRAVASARSSGNELFKESRFPEACFAYGEGLEHDPFNSVLLCNRAACRSKLGQFEKAIEDCTTALNVRPSYIKARLRRADCNAKLERWDASIQDYEMLIREMPGDEEVGRALFEAQVHLKKQRGEDVKEMKFGANVIVVSSNERFRQLVTSPGMSVVLFCKKPSDKQVLQFMEQLCKRYSSVNFLKVDVEDHPYIAKSESVSSVPAFKIYKNGSRVKEIPGNDHEYLESSVKFYST
ncbi:hypothetical protein HHK36_009464 [Tetracentron sinense]|uniref:Thioredoxin domain-containing protein n=1 Tax=Tetracentron sinense TaxID=13715 RepID=A0A834ZCV7_TETSI|nr:hypothetical protein HHK36_009464 [Tetracentron sinense]